MYHKIIGGKKKKNQKNVIKSIEYLLREKKPEDQKYVKILSGSKNDILNFNKYSINKEKQNPYVCGVLSFEEEAIKKELKEKIISEFEDLLFAGIEQENRPPVLWVEHNDKGRVELNYLTFNQLQDKRAYTVYYDKSDRDLVNTYSEIINYENNLSSPFEQRDHRNTLINKPKNDTPQEKKDFINNLNNHILALIISGELSNREETIKYIESIDGVKINRIRKDRISIKCDTFKDDKPLILRGDIYEENRNYSDYTTEYKGTISRDPELVKSKLRELASEHSKLIEKRTNKNKQRYKKSQIKDLQQDRKIIKRENTNIKSINTTNNIDITKSQSFLLPCNNDQVFNERLNNYDVNGTNKTETKREKRTREERFGEVDKQQQFINKELERIRDKQHENRRTLNRLEEKFDICRKSLHGFIRLFKQFLRPAQIYTRYEIKERYKKTKEKRSNHRREYTPF